MELDGSFSAPQAHPVWDGIGDRGASCLVGEREGQRRERPDLTGQRDGDGVEYVTGWSIYFPLSQHTLPPSPFQVNREREGRRVTGENKLSGNISGSSSLYIATIVFHECLSQFKRFSIHI